MKDEEKKLSLGQFLTVLRWLMVYHIRLAPGSAFVSALTAILVTLNPLINAYIFARLLDKILAIVASGSAPEEVIPMLGMLLGYNLVNLGLNYINGYFGTKMVSIGRFKSPQLLYQHVHSLGIQTLENPEVINKIQRSKETLSSLSSDFERMILFFARIITLAVAATTIIKIMPVIAGVVFVSMLPWLASNKVHMRKDWKLYRSETENQRRANTVFGTLIEASNLQEIAITSAYDRLSGVYKQFADKYLKAQLKIMKSWQLFGFLSGILREVASIFGYFTIFKNLFKGSISVGDVTFQMRSLDIFVSSLSSVMSMYNNLYERGMRIKEIKEVFDMKPMVLDGVIMLEDSGRPPKIELKDVEFKYPNADRYVIKGLSLEIQPGEKIAIVGENGAGKTTLVKLLSRFYKTDKGSIYLNGNNINDIQIDSWYKNLGVLFQDYNTYSSLTLRENILLGNSHSESDEERMKLAAERANVGTFIKKYKNGFDQVLSEKFKGGTRPSTGQWQKIAIARFFYRNSPVVIFDEPTAAIDAVAEAEIFGQIYEFFKDKTVIIISHRFSTVRNADKIYVLDDGKIAESGSHEELMQQKGRYYNAFMIQADGYK